MGVTYATWDRRPRVIADALPGEAWRDIALVVGYAAFVGLLAQIVIKLPFTPVPITGQTLGVLLGGTALGWRRGLLGMLLYLAAGLLGLPWFAGGAHGFAMLQAPTLGYLVGFVAAGAATGGLAERGLDRRPWLAFGVMVVGNVIIYAFGVGWLMHAAQLTLPTAFALGVQPFLIGDFIKAVIASALLPGAWLLIGRR